MADRFTVFVRDDKRCLTAKPSERLVLYALASRCDGNGYCWPSVEQLVKDTGLSRATVFRSLERVREILTVDAPGYKHSNSYIFPYQKKPENSVDKLSHGETGSLKLRQEGSHNETRTVSPCDGGSLTVRPEEDIEEYKKFSLSLTPSNHQIHQQDVNNFDGLRRPKTNEELDIVRKWCWEEFLDKFHTDDFIRINRASHWKMLDGVTTIRDLIKDFALKWKKEDWNGWLYYHDKRKGINRGPC